MAEYMGIPYSQVALKAILPAFLYFTGIFIAVHLEAKKLGLKGIPREELPRFSVLAKKIYLLAPLVVLVVLVSTNLRTMQFSASVAIVIAILVGAINKDNRITFRKIIDALEAGAKSTITVAVACGIAGMIAGCITVTGLASKIITAIVSVSGGNWLIALFLTMLCCIVLGMGVPTTANYCIMAATCAPILTTLGVNQIAAHFFVFYFGIVADITPPVALAAYAGSAIAKADPMKTGFNATKLAIAAFIVPYIFAMNPAMLFINTTAFDAAQIALTSVAGLFGIASALNGYLYRSINPLFRVLLIAGGLCMMIPGNVTDLIGVVVVVAIILIQRAAAKKDSSAAA
jgi:TRAP transporter 4TM/12TM fusion protein